MFGCIPTAPKDIAACLRRFPLSRLVGAASPLPDTVNLAPLLDRVQSQGQSNSCVAHTVSTALYLAGQTQGAPIKRPSVRWLYDLARYMRTPGILIDEGSNYRLMFVGAGRHGIVAEERWPFHAARVNEPPPYDLDMAGADALVTGYYAAANDNDELRRALALGHIPCIAINVYRDFNGWRAGDGVYDRPAGDFLGVHALAVVGYRPGAFCIVNSWGTAWGDGGFIWMSDRFMASPDVLERWVVTASPAPR